MGEGKTLMIGQPGVEISGWKSGGVFLKSRWLQLRFVKRCFTRFLVLLPEVRGVVSDIESVFVLSE